MPCPVFSAFFDDFFRSVEFYQPLFGNAPTSRQPSRTDLTDAHGSDEVGTAGTASPKTAGCPRVDARILPGPARIAAAVLPIKVYPIRHESRRPRPREFPGGGELISAITLFVVILGCARPRLRIPLRP